MASVCPSRSSTTVRALRWLRPGTAVPLTDVPAAVSSLKAGSTSRRITSPARMFGRKLSRAPNGANWIVTTLPPPLAEICGTG